MEKYIHEKKPWKNDSFEKYTQKQLGIKPLFIDLLKISS
jgi:hypothetical protein